MSNEPRSIPLFCPRCGLPQNATPEFFPGEHETVDDCLKRLATTVRDQDQRIREQDERITGLIEASGAVLLALDRAGIPVTGQ